MNLIEARKLGYEGWVRSPKRGGYWMKATGAVWIIEGDKFCPDIREEDLDDEDWEPKPAPPKPFEAELWVHDKSGTYSTCKLQGEGPFFASGWRKIRVREVT